uniref:Leucine rich repeat containing 25 n=1 Tax=Sphenodon punctatus TaxID=8508 RepID=A0A8D0GYZ4_SPHPU
MWGLVAALWILQRGPSWASGCDIFIPEQRNQSPNCHALDWKSLNVSWQNQKALDFSARGIAKIQGSTGPGPAVKELNLSHNSLQKLPEAFLAQAAGLEVLSLAYNQLRDLPAKLFNQTGQLRRLNLEGNQLLPKVPDSAFHARLAELHVDCRCDVAGSVLRHCNCPADANCTERECICISPQGRQNLTHYHAQQCHGLSVPAYVGIALASLALLLGGLAAFLLLQRKRKTNNLHSKRDSNMAGASGAPSQPRYISRNGEEAPTTDTGPSSDYENVFIRQTPTKTAGRPKHQTRKHSQPRVPDKEDYDMKSNALQGEQPIYSNTQDLYYNSTETSAPKDEDDVYIIPDQ